MKYFIIAISFLILFCSCNRKNESEISCPQDPSGTISPSCSFWLSGKEIADYKKKALSGDNVSALKLLQYYAFFRNDIKTSEKWMSIAAKNGDERAKDYFRQKIDEVEREKKFNKRNR